MNITKQRKAAQNKNIRSNIISYRIGRIRQMLDAWNSIANKKRRSYLPDIERIADMHMQYAIDEIRGMNARFVITD